MHVKKYRFCTLLLFFYFGSVVAGNEILVTTIGDAGPGSLRQAILDANRTSGFSVIRFDPVNGPFSLPQVIELESDLPVITDDIQVDGYIKDRLWKPSGIKLDGAGKFRVFQVARGVRASISHLTILNGHAAQGGGILNQGDLLVKGVTFQGNRADGEGGALASTDGSVSVINSTFIGNSASGSGGGFAIIKGKATVTNCTFTENTAGNGGGIFNSGRLLLRNTILANSLSGADCVSTAQPLPGSTHNLIEENHGCGRPLGTQDPRLGKLGSYNGPSQTIPLRGGSPAINQGDNASALDENGEPLRWDQRGNGDPRFAAGITDIGAFEQQAVTVLEVDVFEDSDLRGCSRAIGDCSLRGAMAISNASNRHNVITFNKEVFSGRSYLSPESALPLVTSDVILDASRAGPLTLTGNYGVIKASPGVKVTSRSVVIDSRQ